MISVLIVDDHKMFVECLQIGLDKDEFDIQGTASDGLEAVKMVAQLRPQLVILDVNMPGMQGLDVAREIATLSPLTRLVFLTCRCDELCIREAMSLGAKGYITKTDSLVEIKLALQRVAKGEVYISPSLWAPVITHWLHRSQGDGDIDGLSLRDRQVLKLIAEGHSTKEIASMLNISPKTADSHRSRLMAKLEIHEIAGLVRYAVRQGIVAA